MAAYDVLIDDVLLNSFATNITTIEGRRGGPPPKLAGVSHAFMNGVNPLKGGFAPGKFAITGWVSSWNASDARAVGVTAGAQYEANLGNLEMAFYKPGLLKVDKVMLDGTVHRAYCRPTTELVVTESGGVSNPSAQWTIGMENVYSFWTDNAASPATQAFTGATGSPWQTLTILNGSTAPVTDAVFKVTAVSSSITSPTIETDTGFLRWNGSLAVGSSWIADAGTWLSKYGAGLANTASGTDNFNQLSYQGSFNRFLDIWNPYRVRLSGTGTLSGVTFSVTARKKFLA